MSAIRQDIIFRITGAPRERGDHADPPRLRPALFARVADLTRLRYDLPAVLVEPMGGGAPVRSLTGLIDDALRSSVPRGMTGERARRTALRVEREIRSLISQGETGHLSSLWDRAVETLGITGGGELVVDAGQVRAAISADGELADCDARGVGRLVEWIWRATATRRAEALRRAIEDLIVRLDGIVAADLARSAAGRDADHLRAAVGAPQRDLFDFDEMAWLLARPSRARALPDERRQRISRIVAALRAHSTLASDLSSYLFDDLDDALRAYRRRLPAMAELVSALAMGELEARGAYAAEEHDVFFRGFGEGALTPDDLARFPDVFVRVRAAALPRSAAPLEACAAAVPLKVLVETDDVFGVASRLASMAIGLGDVFVVQAASSDLVRLAPRLRSAMEHSGPSLVSVFAPGDAPGLPPYLVAAAATESRAFPTFVYDPAAECGWSARLSLDGDPQLERTWPAHELRYADKHLQRVTETVPFTLADLAICDDRRSRDLERVADAGVPASDLVPFGEWLQNGNAPSPTAVPYVYAVDADDRLIRLVVDDRLVRATLRSGEAWKRLVEVASLKAATGDDVASEGSDRSTPASPRLGEALDGEVEGGRVISRQRAPYAGAEGQKEETSGAPAGASVGARCETPEATSPDSAGSIDPYIETPRCATCNECTDLNPRMFKYNENKQAYIADVTAGTYRDLVEAAEACQVAIIHPGKPRDPNESGLDELVERAAAFA